MIQSITFALFHWKAFNSKRFIIKEIRWYKLNPLYWSSKYFGFGLYSLNKDLRWIEKQLK